MGTANGLPAEGAWWTLTFEGRLAIGDGEGAAMELPDGIAAWPSGSSARAARVRPLAWRVTLTKLPVEVSSAPR